jgi:hypothetical protein
MFLLQLFRNILPCVKPCKWLIILVLALTFIGALTSQINAYVLQYRVIYTRISVLPRRRL